MSQHDMDIANNAGLGFRSDLNLALKALASLSAGPVEPPTKYAYQFWMDTTSAVLKQRNAGNTAWANFVPPGAVPIAGGTMTGNLTIDNDTTNALLVLDKPDGAYSALIQAKRDGKLRWQMQFGNAGAESTGNVGSDFILTAYADDGTTSLGNVFGITRSTQVPYFSKVPTIAGVALGTGTIIRRAYGGPSTSTWTKPTGLRYLEVEILAAGGGGGGAAATAASQGSTGGGGGAGGYARALFAASELSASHTITLGANGTGGTGNAAGTAGATSSFGSLLSATGGAGGTSMAANATTGVNVYGGVGGSGASGDINGVGQRGYNGTSIPFTVTGSKGGRGGDSYWGAGGMELYGSGADGAVGARGGGGGGACNGQSQVVQKGGDGGEGWCLVTEYY